MQDETVRSPNFFLEALHKARGGVIRETNSCVRVRSAFVVDGAFYSALAFGGAL